jgi:anaerobic dimethyl sulfoxide reductase subunit A
MIGSEMTPTASNKVAEDEKIIITTCNSHCGGACILKVHVKNGVITRIETDDGAEPQLRACLKGRAYRQRVYAPDRLKYPLIRVGERGEGKFKRVSWDEALGKVASEVLRVRDTYGSSSIFVKVSAGDIVSLNHSLPITKVLSLMGGFSISWGYHSYEQGVFAELATLGMLDRSRRDDLCNSRLIILWACNPANTVLDTNTTWYLAQAKEKGTRIVSVDPRFTDTTAIFADKWIPIIPGTDTAVLVAMAYVMIKEQLQNQEFLDNHTIGFEKFKAYVIGEEDGVPKTPSWAEAITSVPASCISDLAREYATTKPAAFITGIAPGRTAYGEQYHRAAITLTAMTGNIGIAGGSAGVRSWTMHNDHPLLRTGGLMTNIVNPIVRGQPTYRNFLPTRSNYFLGRGNVCVANIPDALLRGKAGGYATDYKLLFVLNADYPNQNPNINKAVKGLKEIEFVVVVEQFMTPAAKWADVVLPTCTFLERNDITESDGGLFFGYQNKAVDPVGESKSQFHIAQELAHKLGLSEFENKAEDEVLRDMVKGSSISDYDSFKSKGIHRLEFAEPYVAFRKQIEDSKNNPFPTPSGKIEIFSQQIADMNDPGLPPVPKYLEPWEGRSDPLVHKYPLQLLTIHLRRRTNTQFETIPWLKETQAHEIEINPKDALPRGIASGDMVMVVNDRGVTRLPARVTERIMGGVVAIPQGAWYDPDENGLDRAGSANILINDETSTGGGLVTNTCLVQVEKA